MNGALLQSFLINIFMLFFRYWSLRNFGIWLFYGSFSLEYCRKGLTVWPLAKICGPLDNLINLPMSTFFKWKYTKTTVSTSASTLNEVLWCPNGNHDAFSVFEIANRVVYWHFIVLGFRCYSCQVLNHRTSMHVANKSVKDSTHSFFSVFLDSRFVLCLWFYLFKSFILWHFNIKWL